MADFQANVPERIEQSIDDPRQIRQGVRPADRDLPIVQEHEIDVAVGVELGRP